MCAAGPADGLDFDLLEFMGVYLFLIVLCIVEKRLRLIDFVVSIVVALEALEALEA
jgi:hypothetical protein